MIRPSDHLPSALGNADGCRGLCLSSGMITLSQAALVLLTSAGAILEEEFVARCLPGLDKSRRSRCRFRSPWRCDGYNYFPMPGR